MGEKEGKGEEKEKKPAENQKKKEGDEGPPKVVFKVDLHCEGCASKVKRAVKGFEGVEGVTTDMASNKLTVIGRVDAWKLRDRIEAKTRKTVEIVSPVNPPKKDSDGGKKEAEGGKKDADGGKKDASGKKDAGGGKKDAVAAGDLKEKKNAEDKKSKAMAAPAITTVVLRIRLHCDGCIRRIKKTILKIKGVQDVAVDAQKDLVTVRGAVDVNSLPAYLKEKLNRGVEVVTAKNDAATGGGGGGEKKDKPAAAASGGGNGGGEKKEKGGNGGGEKKEKGGDGEKKKEDGAGGEGKKESPTAAATPAPAALEGNKMDYYGNEYGYKVEMLHAPQMFSDENPNACVVM